MTYSQLGQPNHRYSISDIRVLTQSNQLYYCFCTFQKSCRAAPRVIWHCNLDECYIRQQVWWGETRGSKASIASPVNNFTGVLVRNPVPLECGQQYRAQGRMTGQEAQFPGNHERMEMSEQTLSSNRQNIPVEQCRIEGPTIGDLE